MVFIEGSRGNVLFTGDFRLPLNCARRLPFLKESIVQNNCPMPKLDDETKSKVKLIDHLYVDMTFFKPDIRTIPTREESVDVLIKFLNSYLDGTSRHGPYLKLVYFKVI
jgi:hypothetical protein